MSLNPRIRPLLPNEKLEIARAIITLKDGSFSTQDMEHMDKFAWAAPIAPYNAFPDRMKICPECMAPPQPIADFIRPNNALRTVVRYSLPESGTVASPVADVAESCKTCRSSVRETMI